ncbi:MAG: prolyl oligopeptidase family serine peptidase [Holophagales bacterium]|nr:prolyl oligopeptidase family serine peptidase [Holophagales bacterium]
MAESSPARRTVNDGRLVLEGVPEIPARVVEGVRRFQNVRDASLFGFTASGSSILIGTRFGETRQIHRVDAPRGARCQLTYFEEPVLACHRRPGTDEWAYLIDEGGTEAYQIHLLDAATGEDVRISDGTSKHGSLQWSHDGRLLAFQSTRRDGRSLDVWVQDPDSPRSAVCVAEAEGGTWWAPAAWNGDGRRLLVLQYLGATRCRTHLLELSEPRVGGFSAEEVRARPLIGDDRDDGYYEPLDFEPGEEGIYLLSDRGRRHRGLMRLDLDSGELDPLTADLEWSVSTFRLWHPADRSVRERPAGEASQRGAFVVNEEGYGRLHLFDPLTGRHRRVEGLPEGIAGELRFRPDGRRLGFTLDRPDAPKDVWMLELGPEPLDFGAAIPWTESETGGIPRSVFVVPDLVRFPTFDDVKTTDGATRPRTIPTFVFRPRRGTGQGPPWPVVVRIHGGPEAQARPGWNGNLQMWLENLGVAVLVPNVRGSAGYGRDYLRLDDGTLREDSVRDIGALLDWVATQDDLDTDRVAVFGGSYGGYMVLASLVHFGPRIRCGVELVGISNFVTFLENTQAYRRNLRRAEYGDERDPEMRRFLESISPLTHAGRIACPLFVGQGHNDPRVPVSEAEQIVRAVRGSGQEVWYLDALDEGHGFQKKANRDVWEQAVVLFLERHLLG